MAAAGALVVATLKGLVAGHLAGGTVARATLKKPNAIYADNLNKY